MVLLQDFPEGSRTLIFKLLSDKSNALMLCFAGYNTDAKFRQPTLPGHFSSRWDSVKGGVLQFSVSSCFHSLRKSTVA
jgi:hypothetical protein